jgi:SAM-dependent methyltransferase
MTDSVRTFYRQLVPNYEFIFADWAASVRRQSEVLDRLLRQYLPGSSPHTLLDCACGIGTQAIGLALRGYRVHATDISVEAVDHARRQAFELNANLTFGSADFLKLDEALPGTFDAVIALDNAVAHVQQESALEQMMRSMASKVVPGGVVLLSLRDYDELARTQPRTTMPVVTDRVEGRAIVFQVWDWKEDRSGYRLNHYTVRQYGDRWDTTCAVSEMRAWQRADIGNAITKAGLRFTWHLPEETGFHQPIVAGQRKI